MISYPNCKINLGLRIVRKRADGYHDLETIFYPIYGLHDQLEVVPMEDTETDLPDDGIRFRQTGIVVDCPKQDNLIVRCYQQMRAQYPKIGNVSVHLHKQIPFGAGLGGGSSDAAHMAIMLNELYHLGMSKEELIQMVKPLGADCPFFIINQPCFATGIGDELHPIKLNLSQLDVVMIKPEVSVSTREAYCGVKKSGEFAHWVQAIQEGPCAQTAIAQEAYHNDFEDTVFPGHPILADIKKRLLDAGAQYAAMSGSGSTIYGLFQHDAEGRSLANLGLLDKDLASMVILYDSLAQR